MVRIPLISGGGGNFPKNWCTIFEITFDFNSLAPLSAKKLSEFQLNFKHFAFGAMLKIKPRCLKALLTKPRAAASARPKRDKNWKVLRLGHVLKSAYGARRVGRPSFISCFLWYFKCFRRFNVRKRVRKKFSHILNFKCTDSNDSMPVSICGFPYHSSLGSTNKSLKVENSTRHPRSDFDIHLIEG